MSVRLFHKHARLVLVVGREDEGSERWWSPHARPRDWARILVPALELLALEPQPPDAGCARFRIGTLDWTNSRYWSTITLRFHGGSERKRRLVAAALRKAARYRLP